MIGSFAKSPFGTRRTTVADDEPPQKTMNILGIPIRGLGVSVGATSQLLDNEEERKKKVQRFTGEAASTLLGGTLLNNASATLFPAADNSAGNFMTKRLPWQ